MLVTFLLTDDSETVPEAMKPSRCARISDTISGRADTTLMIIDVRRAYFYAKAQRRVFIELPPEDWREGDGKRELLGSGRGRRLRSGKTGTPLDLFCTDTHALRMNM